MLYSFFDGDFNGLAQLSFEESHHLISVRRGKEGEPVTLLDGRGHIARGSIKVANHHAAVVEIQNIETIARSAPPLWLAQAMPLGKTMETIVQKAAELGVSHIIPLCTERSELRLDAERTAKKLEKWRQCAIEAVKQCSNPFLPEIATPVSIAQLVKLPIPKTRAVCSLETGTRPYLQTISNANTIDGLIVAIGPEGDFTPSEYLTMQENDFQPVTLGPLVLRSDTAATASMAIAGEALRAKR